MNSAKSVTATFAKNDTPDNDEPTFTSVPALNANADIAYTYAIVAVDPDAGDTLTLSAPTKPTWLTLTPTGNGTATLAGTPGAGNVGINPVQLRVQDAAGLFATQSFIITVAADPTTTGTVQGRVVDGDGNGIASALVTLTDANGAIVVATLFTQLTDNNGDYLFDGVPLGNYTIAVSIDGKEPSEPVAVAVQVGQTATVPAITLTPAEAAPALKVSMLASHAQAEVGDTITYTYRITNTGNVTLTTISATDNQLEAVAALAGQLAPNGSRSATLTYVVQPSDLPGPLTNTVTVTGTDPFGTEVTSSAGATVILLAEGEQPQQIFLPNVER
jgi:hypothetical protein